MMVTLSGEAPLQIGEDVLDGGNAVRRSGASESVLKRTGTGTASAVKLRKTGSARPLFLPRNWRVTT